jgi:hypothetical protein
MIEPFPPAPEHDPDNALQINYSRPTITTDRAHGRVVNSPGPFSRLVIQGDAKYVELIHRFLNVELQWMWDDISRDRAVERAKG